MTDLVAVITTPPNENPYKVYLGDNEATISEMELLGEVLFYNFDADTVLHLENLLYDKGYVPSEWVAETTEYRVAKLTLVS